jgi:multidrug efflux pump subunit AcrA (membrane-fusion protein)
VTHDDLRAGAAPLIELLQLSRRARAAASADELAFLAVNDSHALQPYRQGALWLRDGGVRALSGVIEPEANAPYALWLNRVCGALHAGFPQAQVVTAADLPEADAQEWAEWLPEFGLWLPLAAQPDQNDDAGGGLLLAAEQPWSEDAVALMQEWMLVWRHAWLAKGGTPPWSPARLLRRLLGALAPAPRQAWWRQRRLRLGAAALAVLLCPVRLSVLAPGELVPSSPAVIRAPLDGVVGQFLIRPNDMVKAGQPLFGFDEAPIAARLDVASQTLSTAEAEYRQFAQQAVSDVKSKAQLSNLLGRIEEKRVEAAFLQGQLERSRVLAPQDGVALFDDPSEWIGKPVQTGERIMRIAAPGDIEVEAWLPLADAIDLPEGAPVSLYLAASPLSALSARVRYLAHDASARPDGGYAYRLRATLDGRSAQRVGLKGTAKISGEWVPLLYWIVRRPLGVLRQALGI